MSLWILDTDCFSLLQRGNQTITQRVRAVTSEEIATTIVTAEEQLRGRLDFIRRAVSETQLTSAYTRLWDTLEDFRSINVLSFDRYAYACFAELLRQKIRVGTQDLRIAAIALSINGILVTRNRRDFVKVPDLNFEDWTLEAV